jgi:hypothetical protein
MLTFIAIVLSIHTASIAALAAMGLQQEQADRAKTPLKQMHLQRNKAKARGLPGLILHVAVMLLIGEP